MTGVSPGDRAAYWTALQTGDEEHALRVVQDAQERGASVVDVLVELVQPTQVQVGDRWEAGAWTVAREHAATAVSEAVVRRLGAELPRPPAGERPLLLACAEQEWHALPALLVACTLFAWGHPVVYLGANASGEAVVGRVLDTGPRAVLLSASLSSSLLRVRRHIEAVRGTGTPIVVGGSAFDADGVRAARLGATAYAASPQEVVDRLRTLPRHVTRAEPLRHPGAAEAAAIQADVDDIVRDTVDATDRALGLTGGGEAAVSPDDWRVVLATHVPHLLGCVSGGLLVRDPTIPAAAGQWLGSLLERRGGDERAVPELWAALRHRLRDYPEAIALLDAVP